MDLSNIMIADELTTAHDVSALVQTVILLAELQQRTADVSFLIISGLAKIAKVGVEIPVLYLDATLERSLIGDPSTASTQHSCRLGLCNLILLTGSVEVRKGSEHVVTIFGFSLFSNSLPLGRWFALNREFVLDYFGSGWWASRYGTEARPKYGWIGNCLIARERRLLCW
jgi:hypothetical protein